MGLGNCDLLPHLLFPISDATFLNLLYNTLFTNKKRRLSIIASPFYVN